MFDTARGGGEFACLCRLVLAAGGSSSTALQIAELDPTVPSRVKSILKSAVAAGSLGDAAWAGRLVELQIATSGFVDSLKNVGVFDRMLDSMRRVPLRTPLAVATVAAAGADVDEVKPAPVSRLTLAGPTLPEMKAQAILVLTREILRAASSAATALVGRELRTSTAAATDRKFLADLADGVTPITSSGSSAAAVLADLADMLAAVPTGSASKLFLVVDSPTAKGLSVKPTTDGTIAFGNMTFSGGEIAGLPALVSDSLPASGGSPTLPTAMLIDASQIAAETDVMTLDVAEHADLQLATNPVEGAANMVSMWQTNCTALRVSRRFGFERLKSSAVAVLDQCDWQRN